MVEPNEDNTAWRRALRRDMVARRAGLTEEIRAAWSAHIADRLLAALPTPRVVAFCWPIKHEPDVRAAIARWAALGAQAALPVVENEAEPSPFAPGRRKPRWSPTAMAFRRRPVANGSPRPDPFASERL